MATQIDAFNQEFTKLGQLFKTVDEGSTQPTQDNQKPPYDALVIPEDVWGRQALNVRLLDLFISSSVANFTQEQLDQLRASLQRAMPDPEKYSEQFVDFVRDRCHGTLEMLRLLVSYVNKCAEKGQKGNALREADALGADHVVDGMPEPLNGLDASVRNGVMHRRVERISLLRKTLQIQKANAALYPVVAKKYQPFKSAFEGAVVAYRDNVGRIIEKMAVPDFFRAYFWNFMLNNLNRCDTSKPEEVTARLERLAAGLKSATDIDSFTTAIDNIPQPLF
ncbi:hypothetical protein HZC21_02405 [Candidatus Peregrinibacteria bacterium]|nr:hypothetical protein [Candidatus Peregrinibacteria bacterium]